MGVKGRRFLAVLVALVMVMTSAVGVFATKESTTQGTNNAVKAVGKVSDKTIKVKTADKTFKYKVNNGKWKTSKSTTLKKIKEGSTVIIKTSGGKTYKWMKTVKIKKATKKKVTWGKVKGANKGYLVEVTKKNGKKIYKKVGKGTTSITASKLGLKSLKGCKVRVRPLKSKSGKVYAGVLCNSKKIK